MLNIDPGQEFAQKKYASQAERKAWSKSLIQLKQNMVKKKQLKEPKVSAAAAKLASERNFSSLGIKMNIGLDEAQTWCPPSCKIMKHMYDGRWRTFFVKPNTACPGKSSSWSSRGEETGELESLRVVLQASWRQFAEATGTMCPFKGLF